MATWLDHCFVTANVFLDGYHYPINGNSLTGQDKQGVRHKKRVKKLTSKSKHSKKMNKGILCHQFAKSVADSPANKE